MAFVIRGEIQRCKLIDPLLAKWSKFIGYHAKLRIACEQRIPSQAVKVRGKSCSGAVDERFASANFNGRSTISRTRRQDRIEVSQITVMKKENTVRSGKLLGCRRISVVRHHNTVVRPFVCPTGGSLLNSLIADRSRIELALKHNANAVVPAMTSTP